jgi:hypothetical protein
MAFDRRDPVLNVEPREDFRPHLGQVYVHPDDVGAFSVLDGARQECLQDWTAQLIPGDDHWPSARDVDAAAYVDAVVARAPRVRALLLDALAALDRSALERHEAVFASCDRDDQLALVEELSQDGARGGFDLVLELTFEAYYRHPRVVAVMKERTGFDATLPHLGSQMQPFDESLLDRVRALPPHYRTVGP